MAPHDRLLHRVWGPEKPGDMQTLRTHLKRLCRTLEEDASNQPHVHLCRAARVGYRMQGRRSRWSRESRGCPLGSYRAIAPEGWGLSLIID